MTSFNKNLSELKGRVKELEKQVGLLNKQLSGSKLKKPKKPRKPSAFNLFMKTEIPNVKSKNPGMPHPQAFKLAAANWSKRKQ